MSHAPTAKPVRRVDLRQTASAAGGLAWELLAAEGPVARGFAQAQYRSPCGTVWRRHRSSDGRATGQATASGSIAWMGGSVFAANVIRDSFAVVDMDGQTGVPVLEDNQIVGRTNGAGKLILTELRSFDANVSASMPGTFR